MSLSIDVDSPPKRGQSSYRNNSASPHLIPRPPSGLKPSKFGPPPPEPENGPKEKISTFKQSDTIVIAKKIDKMKRTITDIKHTIKSKQQKLSELNAIFKKKSWDIDDIAEETTEIERLTKRIRDIEKQLNELIQIPEYEKAYNDFLVSEKNIRKYGISARFAHKSTNVLNINPNPPSSKRDDRIPKRHILHGGRNTRIPHKRVDAIRRKSKRRKSRRVL